MAGELSDGGKPVDADGYIERLYLDTVIEMTRAQISKMPTGGPISIDSVILQGVLVEHEDLKRDNKEVRRQLAELKGDNRRLHEEALDLIATISSQESEIAKLTKELAKARDEIKEAFGNAVMYIEGLSDPKTPDDTDSGAKMADDADPNTNTKI